MRDFILGILFALAIIPIVDGLTSTILTCLEMLKSAISVVIMKNNHKIQNPIEETQRPIGFITEEEVEEDNGI